MENVMNQSTFLHDLSKSTKKPPADEVESFFRPFRVNDTCITPHSKFIQDVWLVDLGELNESDLLLLHQNTKWIAPSYYIRKRYIHRIEEASDDVLFCLVQMQSALALKEWSARYQWRKNEAPDELLVLWYKEGDKEALDILTLRHRKFVKDVIRQRKQKGRFFRGMDDDDVYQESMTGYIKSVKDFKVQRKMKFTVFTRYVIEKYLDTLINQSKNTKNSSLNDSYSFHAPIRNDTEMTFEESFVSELTMPEDLFVKKETFYGIWDILTPLEQEVLLYYAAGHSYEEIGEIINKDKKAVDNTIQRFRAKAEKYEKSTE